MYLETMVTRRRISMFFPDTQLKGKLWALRRSMPHLGDLWDLGGVNGPAVLRHGHSVPGLFSLHALISLLSLLSWIYKAKDTHS